MPESVYKITTDQGTFNVTVDDSAAATPPPAAATVGMAPQSTAQGDPTPPPAQPFASLGIQTVSDEDWAKMTPYERLKGLSQAAGSALFGQAGRDAVDHPGTTLALAALPMVAKGAMGAIPSKARAAGNFQQVMGAAKNVPIDISEPGNAALRIVQLGERGGTAPRAVTQFVRRVTDPAKPTMTYEEARDFASNISRLSADEYNRLPPAMQREMIQLRVALNGSVAKAASAAGKGAEYAAAMKEYAQAARLAQLGDNIWSGVKRSAPYLTAAGATSYGIHKLSDLMGGK